MDHRKRLPTSNNVPERFDLGKISLGTNWSNHPIQRNREKLSNQREIYKRKEKPNTRKELQNQNFNNAKGIHQERKNQNDWKNLQISITNSTVIIWKCYFTHTPHLSITFGTSFLFKETFTFLWNLNVRSTLNHISWQDWYFTQCHRAVSLNCLPWEILFVGNMTLKIFHL